MKPDWTPRHHQLGIYCSPACGGRCTRVAYEEAVTEAAKLARHMGAGWSPEVWENSGWYFKAHKGLADIHCNSYRSEGVKSYTIFFNTMPQVVKRGVTPEEALGLAIAEVRFIQNKLDVDLAALLKR